MICAHELRKRHKNQEFVEDFAHGIIIAVFTANSIFCPFFSTLTIADEGVCVIWLR
jgi:hypothetical protein